jgi:hypothetical protein
MYFFRLLDILRADYEAVLAVVGDAAFHNLVTDYLCACPSTHPSVRNVGAGLPPYLRSHAFVADRPWLAELAALERARVEVFDGADAEPLTLDELRALAADDFARLPLPLVPSRAVVEARFAVDDVWRAVDQGATVRRPAPEPRTLIVWRHQLAVHHRPLDPGEGEALARAQAGAPFGLICDLFAQELPVEAAAAAAFRMLARWVTDGLIARP